MWWTINHIHNVSALSNMLEGKKCCRGKVEQNKGDLECGGVLEAGCSISEKMPFEQRVEGAEWMSG